MFKKRLIATIIACAFAAPASANIQSEMQSWFNDMGSYGNVTTPQAIKGQTGNFYTGGSLYMRTPVRNYSLASVTPPTFRAGCGGIDLYAGAFSFINSEQLTALIRNVANNAVGAAFMMAVQSVSPELADILKSMQDIAQKANGMLNMNSCQAAESLIAMTPLPQMAQKAKEKMNAQNNGPTLLNQFSDSLKGLSSWMDSVSTRKSTLDQAAATDEKLKKYLKPGNVTWEALSKSDAPDDIKKLMMGLVGVTIVRATGAGTDNDEPIVERKFGILHFKDLIGKAGESSKTVKVWGCIDNECSSVSEQNHTITPFAYLVRQAITSGVNNIALRSGQNFSATEKFFLSGSTTPLWKLISVSASIPFSSQALDEYSEVIATEVAANFAVNMMKEMNKALVNARGFQDPITQTIIGDMRTEWQWVMEDIRKETSLAYQKGISIAEQSRNMQFINQAMMSAVSSDVRKSLMVFGRK